MAFRGYCSAPQGSGNLSENQTPRQILSGLLNVSFGLILLGATFVVGVLLGGPVGLATVAFFAEFPWLSQIPGGKQLIPCNLQDCLV